jgi:hypothetical protein
MFRTVPLYIIRSFSLYTQQCYIPMSYRFADSLLASCQLSADWYEIYHCFVYSEKTPDDRQRNCPKHVEVHKFEKLVHLFGFFIRNLK